MHVWLRNVLHINWHIPVKRKETCAREVEREKERGGEGERRREERRRGREEERGGEGERRRTVREEKEEVVLWTLQSHKWVSSSYPCLVPRPHPARISLPV